MEGETFGPNYGSAAPQERVEAPHSYRTEPPGTPTAEIESLHYSGDCRAPWGLLWRGLASPTGIHIQLTDTGGNGAEDSVDSSGCLSWSRWGNVGAA